MPAFSLVVAPPRLTAKLHSGYNAPLPIIRSEDRTIPQLRYFA